MIATASFVLTLPLVSKPPMPAAINQLSPPGIIPPLGSAFNPRALETDGHLMLNATCFRGQAPLSAARSGCEGCVAVPLRWYPYSVPRLENDGPYD